MSTIDQLVRLARFYRLRMRRVLGAGLASCVLLVALPAPPAAAQTPAPAPARVSFPVPETVRIPAGCHEMGSPVSETERDGDERQHDLCVDAFGMGKTEVTVGQFRRFLDASGHRTDAERDSGQQRGCWTYEDGKGEYRDGRSWRNPGFAQGDDHPAVCVSWNDAQAYVEWLSQETGRAYRLPTEAEWEYAARAGSRSARFWGDDPDEACNHANVYDLTGKRVNTFAWAHHDCDDGVAHTAPVGRYQANAYGLDDMLGNAWEWTCSAYDEDYGGAEQRCLPASNVSQRALRGGSWYYIPADVRAAARGRGGPSGRYHALGFRVAED